MLLLGRNDSLQSRDSPTNGFIQILADVVQEVLHYPPDIPAEQSNLYEKGTPFIHLLNHHHDSLILIKLGKDFLQPREGRVVIGDNRQLSIPDNYSCHVFFSLPLILPRFRIFFDFPASFPGLFGDRNKEKFLLFYFPFFWHPPGPL